MFVKLKIIFRSRVSLSSRY